MLPATLPCTDCDGTLHLLTVLDPEVPLLAGEVILYRCNSCLERFDIVWEDEGDRW